MLPIPWRYVESWSCTGCGLCCKDYEVVLEFPEWINIVKAYGIDFTVPGISRLHIRRKNDGTCAFLNNYDRSCLCSLQQTKPIACKLWPFKITDKPKWGRPREALYDLTDMKLYIYVDPNCAGIRWGHPTYKLTSTVLPEFIDLALGRRRKQLYSTSTFSSFQPWNLI